MKSRAQTVLDEWRAKATQDSDWDGFVDAIIIAIDRDTENSSGPCLRSKFSGEYCYLEEIPAADISNRGMWSGPCLILALEEK